ncbi:MAG: hypothetical protein Q7K37_13380 [Dehalococcoidia bacterium]|nr:hypothetical protein [Dehalococcoidia bacterium]
MTSSTVKPSRSRMTGIAPIFPAPSHRAGPPTAETTSWLAWFDGLPEAGVLVNAIAGD